MLCTHPPPHKTRLPTRSLPFLLYATHLHGRLLRLIFKPYLSPYYPYAGALYNGALPYAGAYNPLARRIYMNLLNTPEALALTAPLIEFGFSDAGDALVASTGYVPIPEVEQEEMLDRISMA